MGLSCRFIILLTSFMCIFKINIYIILKTVKGRITGTSLKGESIVTGNAFKKRLVNEHPGVDRLKAFAH